MKLVSSSKMLHECVKVNLKSKSCLLLNTAPEKQIAFVHLYYYGGRQSVLNVIQVRKFLLLCSKSSSHHHLFEPEDEATLLSHFQLQCAEAKHQLQNVELRSWWCDDISYLKSEIRLSMTQWLCHGRHLVFPDYVSFKSVKSFAVLSKSQRVGRFWAVNNEGNTTLVADLTSCI